MKPSLQQIADEIVVLRQLKRELPLLGPGGQDAVVGIKAQLAVLLNRLPTEAISKKHYSTFEYESAVLAAEWLVGNLNEPPSSGWLCSERANRSKALREAIASGRLLS